MGRCLPRGGTEEHDGAALDGSGRSQRYRRACGSRRSGAVVFVLWLLARRGGGKAAGADLRRVGNELKVARGDLVQARHDHATEITKLGRELENLRAVAAGKMPPELEEWRRRAEAAETRLASERATLEAQYGSG